jgi:hypothetical protein
MPKWSQVETVDDLKNRIKYLVDCCLVGLTDDFMPLRVVAAWAEMDDITDDHRMVIFETQFKTFCFLEESEDYTGHG